jgi:hypothetical protein
LLTSNRERHFLDREEWNITHPREYKREQEILKGQRKAIIRKIVKRVISPGGDTYSSEFSRAEEIIADYAIKHYGLFARVPRILAMVMDALIEDLNDITASNSTHPHGKNQ